MPENINVMVWVWLGVTAAALFLEASTPSLISIWFALGALVALAANCLGATPAAQALLFVFCSLGALLLARPLAKRLLDPRIVPTNADRLLGTQCKVTEDIDNEDACGAVYADGKIWTARSEDNEPIAAGENVEVVRMEGVKLIVRPCRESSVKNHTIHSI